MVARLKSNPVVRLLTVLTMLLLLLYTGVASAGVEEGPYTEAQSPEEGLFSQAPMLWMQGQAEASVTRSRQVRVNFDLLGSRAAPASRVRLNLFGDTAFDAILERTETNALGSFAWVGNLEGVRHGRAVLVQTNGLLFGKISMPGAIYEVRPVGDSQHVIDQIDQSAFPAELDPIPAGGTGLSAAGVTAVQADACDEILVLVAYSPEARAADGGAANIEARIALAVVETNDSYINSGLVQRIHLAGTMETAAGDAQNDFDLDLAALQDLTDGIFDDVDAAREFHFADQVALIIENDDYCGLGYVNSDAASAFVTVHRTCATGYYSFAHELGHNSGARHDWFVDDTDSYAHGWVYLPDDWRTIMAYNNECDCSDEADPCPDYDDRVTQGTPYCDRLQYWSNPDVDYGGIAMGVADGTSRSCSEKSYSPQPRTCDADNRTKLNATCDTVANFRSGNQPPQVTVVDDAVTFDEGDLATNTGSVSDPDGHTVELTASVGDVVNNGDDTWSWSFATDDGPAESQTVTIYADDGHLGTDEVSFELTVENVAPEATFNFPTEVDEGHTFDLSLTGASDPSTADTVAGFLYAFDCGDGYGAWSASDNETCQTYDNGILDVKAKIKDKDDGVTEYEDQVTVLNVPPELTIDIDEQTLQYSDHLCPVLITATDVALDPLTPWGALPASLGLTDLGCVVSGDGIWHTCSWQLEGTLDEPEGSYLVTVNVDDDDGGTSAVDTTIIVEPEDADIWLEDANPVAVGVDGDGLDSLAFTLTAYVQESQPDVASCGADPGDINDAQVEITLVPVGPGSPVTELCSNAAVTGTGYDAVLTAECLFDDVPVNVYHVQATVVGGYYVSGLVEDVLVISDPSLGFTTGGGWFTWPGDGDKTNFGYNVKYNKSVHGHLLLMRHTGGGAMYGLKAKDLYGLAIGKFDDGGTTVGWAAFVGKTIYMEPGWPTPMDDYTFIMYVEDWNEPGKGYDQVWLEVRDGDGAVVIPAMSMALPAIDNTETLGGGNIAVPHQGIQ